MVPLVSRSERPLLGGSSCFDTCSKWLLDLIKRVRDAFMCVAQAINSVLSCWRSKERGYVPNGEKIDLYISMAGNPAHMGHMQMIALAVNRLVQEGYQVDRVKVALSSEDYLQQKVHWTNVSIETNRGKPGVEPEMPRILIPRDKRIVFLRAAIDQARQEGVFNQDLLIDYFDDVQGHEKGKKMFKVRGADHVEDLGNIPHAVIVTREGKMPEGVTPLHTKDQSRFIINNEDTKTSTYSSSAIQNGAYEQLPQSMQEEFKRLREG